MNCTVLDMSTAAYSTQLQNPQLWVGVLFSVNICSLLFHCVTYLPTLTEVHSPTLQRRKSPESEKIATSYVAAKRIQSKT